MPVNFDNESQLDDFLNKLVMDSKSEEQTEWVRNYVKMYMNEPAGNLGSITLLPILAKKLGSFYCKLHSVREWYGASSVIDNDEGAATYRVLPREFYGELSPEHEKLYADVVDKFEEANKLGVFGYEGDRRLKFKNYSLFTGVVLEQVDESNKPKDDNINKAVLAIYPSAAPIFALQGAISAKQAVIKDKLKPWLLNFLTPSLTDRNGVITIKFGKKHNGQPGYDSTIGLEINSEYSKVVPEGFVISEEQSEALSDPIKLFLGWMYDNNNNAYFNELIFKELLEDLTISINQQKLAATTTENEVETPNKNSAVDPMIQKPEFPGVDNNKPAEGTVSKNPFDIV